ncbi:F-box only protein 24-like [Osmerus mordax]|uniref:F-box only protein 24-like n=1 Tax=Osmerus mordax TaxID=8014 RepID=UPI00350EC8CC
MSEASKTLEIRLRSRFYERQTGTSPKLEEVLKQVSVSDVISFGATCRAFHDLSLSPALWKQIYYSRVARPYPFKDTPPDWRRVTIMKHTQSLLIQRLSPGSSRGSPPYFPGSVMRASAPPQALGYRRALPTKDHELLWDQQGTIFLLSNADPAHRPQGLATGRLERHSSSHVLCQGAKDFSVDPRSDVSCRKYIYVLVTHSKPAPLGSEGPPPRCDCVEVYQQDIRTKVFRMTFHPSLSFTQIRVMGSETHRTLLLLTATGKVYALSVNETQLTTPPSYTVQLALRKVSTSLPQLPITQIHTSCRSALYLTVEGSVFMEVHSPGVYHTLFGTQLGYDPRDIYVPLPLRLPFKVVRCSLGLSHLCLLDDCGRMFMQGSNRYGQLGTGDKIDRGHPTQVCVCVRVALSLVPVDVWCGLNHSLALLQAESGSKEVQGCGCGAGGRLPGCFKGSAVFVKLSVRVPRTTRSICSSQDLLYLLTCHDVAETPLFSRPHPPIQQAEREAGAERDVLQRQLSLMKSKGPSAAVGMKMLQDAVQNLMTLLNPVHRNFLVDALGLIQKASDKKPLES